MDELDENPAAALEIATDTDAGGAPLVALTGELDSSNVERLSDVLQPLVALGPSALTFDLEGLRFMDSAGISVLVTVAAEVETVQIREPTPIVRRLIEVTGLSSVLRVLP